MLSSIWLSCILEMRINAWYEKPLTDSIVLVSQINIATLAAWKHWKDARVVEWGGLENR